MQILLIGAAGQLGQELQQTLNPLGKVVAVQRETLDLTQPDRIQQIIAETAPDVIVNAAAYTAVDKAELEPDVAEAVNSVAPRVMAEAADRLKAPLVHVSTDYVFDGQKSTPYTEEDLPNPAGAYGRSKLLGEAGIRQACDRHVILRTAWVYGTYGKSNFVKTMLRLGSDRDEIRVVADQIGTPTWAADIAQAIAQLLPKLTASATELNLFGTYHFTNSGSASWYDFAVAIFEEARAIGFPLRMQHVIPITTPEYPTPAQRPAYSVLACKKISLVLQAQPSHWRHSLRQMLRELYLYNYEGNYSVGR
jgi:dTDP-4-dehydrorhamnose reductase